MIRLYKNEKGFTLVEIMIVVLIIGVIAALAIPNLMSAQKTAWAKTCEANRSTILAAAELYRIQNSGEIPADMDDLAEDRGYGPALPNAPDCPANGEMKYYINEENGILSVGCENQDDDLHK